MFRNTLTANDNYPVQDCGNLSSSIQMHLSLKSKIFSHLIVTNSQTIGVFRNTLTANEYCPVQERGNLSSVIQMQLS